MFKEFFDVVLYVNIVILITKHTHKKGNCDLRSTNIKHKLNKLNETLPTKEQTASLVLLVLKRVTPNSSTKP